MSTFKRIIVFGAHGKIGQQLVGQACRDGYSVTSVVRNQQQADHVSHISGNNPNLLTNQLTLDDASVSDLTQVIAGHDAVVFTAGSAGKDLLKVDLDGAVKTFEASSAANVKRLIIVSAVHADKREFFQDTGLRNYYIAKHYADRILINEFSQKLDFTILKPTVLTDEPGTGKVKILESLLEPYGTISRADVATVILATLSNPNTYGKSYDFKNGDSDIHASSTFC